MEDESATCPCGHVSPVSFARSEGCDDEIEIRRAAGEEGSGEEEKASERKLTRGEERDEDCENDGSQVEYDGVLVAEGQCCDESTLQRNWKH